MTSNHISYLLFCLSCKNSAKTKINNVLTDLEQQYYYVFSLMFEKFQFDSGGENRENVLSDFITIHFSKSMFYLQQFQLL